MQNNKNSVEKYTFGYRDTSLLNTSLQVLSSFHSQFRVGYRMSIRNVIAEVRTNRLGLLWLALSPLIYVCAFIILRSSFSETIPLTVGILSLICGLVIFQSWLDSCLNQLSSFSVNSALLKNIGICPDTFFYSSLIKSIILNTPKIGFVIIYAIFSGAVSTSSATLYLITFLLASLNGASIGYLLAPLASLMNDIKVSIQSSSLFLMASSSVFVNLSTFKIGIFDYLAINPAAVFVETARKILIGQETSLSNFYYHWIIASLIIALFSLTINRITKRIIAERL